MKVPFVNLSAQFNELELEFIDALKRVGRTGGYILGQEVESFEAGLAKICGTEYAVSVANGTDALMLVLKAWGIGAGDEVITVTNSFIASGGAIAATGAKPVFVDVSEDLNINPSIIEPAISAKTKAIIPVHLTGTPAKMDEINSIANKYNLKVLEDAAQAIGATYKGIPVGGLGNAAAFSLHPLKNLHLLGDAGFISTNDSNLYEDLIKLRNHGLVNRNESVQWGFNSRLDALQAAFGNIKLKYFEQWTKRFQQIAEQYDRALNSYVQCPIVEKGNTAVFHNFVIKTLKRDQLISFLADKGVETKIHYPIPLHLMGCSSGLGYQQGDFPVAELQSEQIMSLPIYPELTESPLKTKWIETEIKTTVQTPTDYSPEMHSA